MQIKARHLFSLSSLGDGSPRALSDGDSVRLHTQRCRDDCVRARGMTLSQTAGESPVGQVELAFAMLILASLVSPVFEVDARFCIGIINR